ncbi:MAG: phosphatidylglycerol lysyltransferase domain-containing protein [Candidatus Omnitrophica bacterium]|nr:phosphatidylglycerol lysyltransferase domain-containing protein [Candidatus Omnitrophota bacterium]
MKNLCIPQLIPQEICLKCENCCRFSEEFSPWSPYILKGERECFNSQEVLPFFIKSYGINLKLKKEKDFFVCPFFDLAYKKCSLYALRPFDCALYPFILFYHQNYSQVLLGIDLQCPYLSTLKKEVLFNFALRIKKIVEEEILEMIYEHPGVIMDYQTNFQPLFPLDKLNRRIFGENSGLSIISLRDKEIFDNFFSKYGGAFSYAFTYLYAWRDIAYLLWKSVGDVLLVFWKQKEDFFLLLPPLGNFLSGEVFSYLIQLLGEKIRIKNIREEERDFFLRKGFTLKPTAGEYLYLSGKMINLSGKELKKKRGESNYFRKHYLPEVKDLQAEDRGKCLKLYEDWAKERCAEKRSDYYLMLLEDNFFAQRRLLLDYAVLNLQGIKVEVGGETVGYSFGYPLNEQEFCIFAEITHLKLKGISAFIFQEFSRKLKAYKFINAMDDAGLENLRREKLSYSPLLVKTIYSAEGNQGVG